ncbi:MAG: ROK family protein [Chloroflexota bacterium]
MLAKTVIAVDIGGTKIAIARGDRQGNLAEVRTFATPHGRPQETLPAALAAIEAHVTSLLEGHVGGIGIAAPGPTDCAEGILLLAPSMGWQNVPLQAHFERRFGVPVRVSNDVQAAALGELRFGWGQKPLDDGRLPLHLFWMTVSTGIGGCIVTNGSVYRGKGAAGEIGHLILDEHGPLGACGHTGCLESLACGPAIAAEARRRIAQGEPSMALTLAGSIEQVTPPLLVQAAHQGDALACQLWQEAGAAIGKALSYAINLLDPDLLVLGGGVILGAGDLILEPITACAYDPKHSLPGMRHRPPPIVKAWHGTNAGLVGATALGITACEESSIPVTETSPTTAPGKVPSG